MSRSLATSTRKSYDRTLVQFHQFIKGLYPKFVIFPANPGHVALFATALFEKGLSPLSVVSKLSAISFFYKSFGKKDPCDDFLIEKLLSGMKKDKPQADIRCPLSISAVHKVCTVLAVLHTDGFKRALIKAMIVLSFHAFLRPGEITDSPNNIMAQQLSVSKGSICIKFYKFKHHVGSPVTIVVKPTGSVFCPVKVLLEYLYLRGNHPGPLFSFLDRAPVSYMYYHDVFLRAVRSAGIKYHVSPHSCRIGAATHAAVLGTPAEEIRRMGRWNSDAFRKYIRVPSVPTLE